MSVRLSRVPFFVAAAAVALPALLIAACSSSKGGNSSVSTQGSGGNGTGGTTGTLSGSGAGSGMQSTGALMLPDSGPDGEGCPKQCSSDYQSVVDCHGNVLTQCTGTQGCNPGYWTCADACTVAVSAQTSIGCDFYATNMDQTFANLCFAAFVANTWSTPVHINVSFEGTPYTNVENFTRIPSGSGSNVTYNAYDPTAGLPPGEVAIVFLSGYGPGSTATSVPCPAPTASQQGSMVWNTSGTGNSFHVTTDVPVVMYQMNPYGGSFAATTGASLLLPTSVWGTNYVSVMAAPVVNATFQGQTYTYSPSMNIVAANDNTTVTLLPKAAIVGGSWGNGLPAGAANTPYKFTLNTGNQAQFTQQTDLTGTVVSSTSPVGFMAGHQCMQLPVGTSFCDHGEQMLPPVKALGNEYVGVMWRPRVTGDQAMWHLVGAVNGTTLTYQPSTPPGAPLSLSAGEALDFTTDQPFIVQSQDTMHPFMLFERMSGAQWTQLSDKSGYGDPDFVLGVPPQQYLSNYVFFTDLTYPETNLVVIRAPDPYNNGAFDDVSLDCLSAPLTGWQSIGQYQWTRVDLETGFNSVNGCANGPHHMQSKAPFGLWVWGWSNPTTMCPDPATGKPAPCVNVSYGYPGGMNVAPINPVIIPPIAT
jgi:hypothetical protein